VFTLASRAFKGWPDNHVVKQMIMRFCHGCLDKAAGQLAINARPQTMEAALDRIRWCQYSSKEIYGDAQRDVRLVGGQSRDYYVSQVTSREPFRSASPGPRRAYSGANRERDSPDRYRSPDRRNSWEVNQELVRGLREVTQQLWEVTKRLESLDGRGERVENMVKDMSGRLSRSQWRSPSPRQRSGSAEFSRSSSPITCYHCQEKGHIRADCPNRAKQVKFLKDETLNEQGL